MSAMDELRALLLPIAVVGGVALLIAAVAQLLAGSDPSRGDAAATPPPLVELATPSPNVWIAIPTPGQATEAICERPPEPWMVPWPVTGVVVNHAGETSVTVLRGPGEVDVAPLFRIATYTSTGSIGDLPPSRGVAAGHRMVNVSSPPASGVSVAWWLEGGRRCPVVAAVLFWRERTEAEREDLLVEIVASIPPIGGGRMPGTDGNGLLVCGNISCEIRAEGDGGRLAWQGRPFRYAVSSDARQIADWGQGPGELWLFAARDPERRMLALSVDTESINAVVWSVDGRSLLVAVGTSTAIQGVPGVHPTSSRLLIVERDGSGAREIARAVEGRSLRPVAWDGARGVGVAVEHAGQAGPWRYLYLAADGSVIVTDLPQAGPQPTMHADGFAVSGDGRFVLGVWSDGARASVRFWPVDDPEFREARELPLDGLPPIAATWRPGRAEVVVRRIQGFEIWSLDGRRLLAREWDQRFPQVVFRHDGTAIYRPLADGDVERLDLVTGETRVFRRTGFIGASVDLR